MMGYLGAGGPVVNSTNIDKGITTLAIKHLKLEHYKHYKHFTPFQRTLQT